MQTLLAIDRVAFTLFGNEIYWSSFLFISFACLQKTD